MHMLSSAATKLAIHARSGSGFLWSHLRTRIYLSSQAVRYAQRAPGLCSAPGPEGALSVSALFCKLTADSCLEHHHNAGCTEHKVSLHCLAAAGT